MQFLNGLEVLLFLTQNENFILTNSLYAGRAKKIKCFTFKNLSGKSLTKLLIKLAREPKMVGVEENGFSYRDLKLIKEKLAPCETVDVEDLVSKQRLIKDKNELNLLKEAARITDAGYKFALGQLKRGMTEKDLATEITVFFTREAEGNAFEPIVAFKKSSAIPHHRAGQVRLEKQGMLLMDFGCRYQGYCGDMTRMIHLGRPTSKYKEVYQAVLRAQEEGLKKVKVGLTGQEADKIVRDYLIKRGYGKHFTHSVGHGIGLSPHEEPDLNLKSRQALKNGMVFSVEPGVYLPGWGGVRIEDVVYLEGDRPVRLTQTTRELIEHSFQSC